MLFIAKNKIACSLFLTQSEAINKNKTKNKDIKHSLHKDCLTLKIHTTIQVLYL